MKTCQTIFILIVLMIAPSAKGQYIELFQRSESTNSLSINTDGVINKEEWLNSKTITIKRDNEWNINIHIKIDQEYLCVAFENLTSKNKGILNTEVLIQRNPEDDKWNDNTYWFHSSYSNCYSKGEYYRWEQCSTDQRDWKANTFPFKNGNDNIEFRISLKKLDLNTTGSKNQIKIAFKLSDVSEVHSYWPQQAQIESPKTWGMLIFN